MFPVDLVVCGSVAVNRRGARIGKGAGYSDIEVALLAEAGLIRPETVIVTTLHQLQVVEEELPETEHDFRVDVIVTPDETIRCELSRRPKASCWSSSTPLKRVAFPS
jgi:5-formyltetrahydrofolate cyclo-ligase